MHDESNKQPCCIPPWEPPQVIPAQVRRVNNLIFRKINQFHRENNVVFRCSIGFSLQYSGAQRP